MERNFFQSVFVIFIVEQFYFCRVDFGPVYLVAVIENLLQFIFVALLVALRLAQHLKLLVGFFGPVSHKK